MVKTRQKFTTVLAAFFAVTMGLQAQGTAASDATAQQAKNQLTDAASKGTPLDAQINVVENVNIEAVMLPWDISRRVFGKEIADNYAVIEVNISNRSNDAALIIQSMFIDLSRWSLAGPGGGMIAGGAARAQTQKPFQARGNPTEVSSVEYRVVRGDLLDRQPWTKRNVTYRTIQVLGSIGTSFAFPFSKDVVAGINAWNGGVVPGFATLFPDGTQAQLDRISDYGFRNNKVIPQQAADIVIAFFPIQRFLTPTLQKVFLRTPSLFFNPMLMVLDPKTRTSLKPILNNVLGDDAAVNQRFNEMMAAYQKLDQEAVENAQEGLLDAIDRVKRANAALIKDDGMVQQDQNNPNVDLKAAAARKATQAQDAAELMKAQAIRDTAKKALGELTKDLNANTLYKMLTALSLNNIQIVVSGIMTVDVDNVPPIVTSFTCTNDGQPDQLWGSPGDKVCTIHGSFLTSGDPAVTGSDSVTLSGVSTGSSDGVLNTKLTLKDAVPPKTVLVFTVSKKNKQGSTVQSMKFNYTVPDYKQGAPTIAGVAAKETTVTVTGTNYFNTTSLPLVVTAHAVTPSGVADQKIDKPTSTATQITFDDKGFAIACWQVQVKVGNVSAPQSTDNPPKDQFAIVPVPKVDTATLSGTTLTVTGSQFVDLAECGEALTWEVLSDAAGAKPQAIDKPVVSADGKTATLTVTAAPTGLKWKEVHALLKGTQAATAAITSK